ncbi:hypothetical protein D9758_009583 [Tetrapyrgos nigripes]|uniref:NADP-dependent oxidoreductase domain-containing protein n=1 Tax=Tetrapyrgos nigripes TaxID=182062 RepID=A0A8H5LMK5_9AGAR|nr:hypothetical protein D9758_009583 [Tetrapyrgos nigripes]
MFTSGHVNTMDDVLISQLPPQLLKSSLRLLVSQSLEAQRTFVSHVRTRLLTNPPELLPADQLFPSSPLKEPEYPQFISDIRCWFSSKLAKESLPLLTHLLNAIPMAGARWVTDDGDHTTSAHALGAALASVCGDLVQAIQALKESLNASGTSSPDDETKDLLLELLDSLARCQSYCIQERLDFPFIRARKQVQDFLDASTPPISLTHAANSAHQTLILNYDLHINGVDTVQTKSVPLKMLIALSSSTSPTANEIIINCNLAQWSQIAYAELGAQTGSTTSLRLPRLLNGFWQMSSAAWGSASSAKQEKALVELIESGLVASDMADHYGDAELVWGSFRKSLPSEVQQQVIACTKWCVFRPLKIEGDCLDELVLERVKERYKRLGGRVELLQFHWYDYSNKIYLPILAKLVQITKTHPQLVTNVGLCNFDSKHMEEAAEYLLNKIGEVGVVSNQVQFSLVDARPTVEMSEVCLKYGIKLLTYGSFCGGFLSQKWLGQKSPDVYSESAALTPSQRKYFDMILTWGTWPKFQELLATLRSIADKHSTPRQALTLTNVATRWVLDRPEVASVIVGTRLGVSSNVQENLNVFGLRLDEDDRNRLDSFALGDSARRVWEMVGDCGAEYSTNTKSKV